MRFMNRDDVPTSPSRCPPSLRWGLTNVAALACLLLPMGCATVPAEIVQLSYVTGEDLQSLQASSDGLIRELYAQLRARRIAYLEDRWIPTYLADWVQEGRLIHIAQGAVVWSDDAEDFTAPDAARAEAQRLESVQAWAEAALSDIADKRYALLAPLDAEEDSLRSAFQLSFGQAIEANAVITAHLNSIRKVKEREDQLLAAMRLRALRDSLTTGLSEASQRAARGLEEIERVDGLLDGGMPGRSPKTGKGGN